MTKVLVLSGGNSNEREVSLNSGANVTAALQEAGYETVNYDPADSGTDLADVAAGCEVAFPALHGAEGEDGEMQSRLESLLLPYVGSDVAASELCFDKWKHRALLTSHDIPMAPAELVDVNSFRQSKLLQEPFVLKPFKGGSSVDTLIMHTLDNFDPADVAKYFQNYRQMLLEKLIVGTEITIGILGTTALPVIEIIPPAGKDFDYENKYNGATQELCPPQHVAPGVQLKAQDLALQIHKLCGCRDMSRTDMIVTPDDQLFVLETNTIPGLTKESLLPKAAAVAGISMPALCDQLVRMAQSRIAV